MISKQSIFNCFVILALLAGLGACQPPATATPIPDTPSPVQTDTPSPTPSAPIPPPADCRQTILEPTELIHAVHMGGNWGTNIESENTLPTEYFEYLRNLNVNWVGISVALHYDDSMDSTVERDYSVDFVPTFTDEFLREMIRAFHHHGICVYLTLAFETYLAELADHPIARWQLGGHTPIFDDGRILPEFWPWAIDHPDHERFVAEFWETYTEQVVHFGQLAEEEGVALYSLGTETEGLFRTRPSDEWPNDFSKELRTMVAAVREVYSGPLTYDLGFWVFTEPENRGGLGSYYLWEDLDLDVIGLSAYPPLADCPPITAFSVESLEKRWEKFFQDHLIPLQETNPDRPIFFTEFGYSDSLGSVVEASADSFTEKILSDRDGSGFDDGEEMQANIHQALFNVMDRYPGVVNGMFQWDMMMANDVQWASFDANIRDIPIRGRLAEDVVRIYYGAAPRSITPTPLPVPSDTPPLKFGETCEIYDDQFSIEWWIVWPWESEVDTNSSEISYLGENAIKASLQPNGGFAVIVGPQIELSPFNWLSFYINGGEEANQQIGIVLGFHEGWMTPPLNVTDYIEGGVLEPEQWHLVMVPISDLSPNGGAIDQLNFVGMDGKAVPTFYIDEIRFVSAGP